MVTIEKISYLLDRIVEQEPSLMDLKIIIEILEVDDLKKNDYTHGRVKGILGKKFRKDNDKSEVKYTIQVVEDQYYSDPNIKYESCIYITKSKYGKFLESLDIEVDENVSLLIIILHELGHIYNKNKYMTTYNNYSMYKDVCKTQTTVLKLFYKAIDVSDIIEIHKNKWEELQADVFMYKNFYTIYKNMVNNKVTF